MKIIGHENKNQCKILIDSLIYSSLRGNYWTLICVLFYIRLFIKLLLMMIMPPRGFKPLRKYINMIFLLYHYKESCAFLCPVEYIIIIYHVLSQRRNPFWNIFHMLLSSLTTNNTTQETHNTKSHILFV